MPTMSDDDAPHGALRDRLTGLTSPVEWLVADFLLKAGPRAGAMSAREIARATGTSDATVIRTARSLGFAGFRELKRFVAGQTDDLPLEERLRVSLDADPDPDAELWASIERQRTALETMGQTVAKADFRRANRVIAKAPYVWWSGVGPSAHLAGYAAFLFRRLGKDSAALTHAGFDSADELLAVKAGHAVVVLAYGRLHRYVRVLLDRASSVRAPVILLTDSLSLSKEWDISARLVSGRGPRGTFSSHVTTTLMIEALGLAMAESTPDRAKASIEQLNALRGAIAGRPLGVDP
jgi:DNA-binding MurR/RpiR family transcriptional regulator